MKYHKLDGLSNIHLILIVLKAGKSKMKVTADLVLNESLLSDLQMATFCCVLTWWREEAMVSLLIGLLTSSWGLRPHNLIKT